MMKIVADHFSANQLIKEQIHLFGSTQMYSDREGCDGFIYLVLILNKILGMLKISYTRYERSTQVKITSITTFPAACERPEGRMKESLIKVMTISTFASF